MRFGWEFVHDATESGLGSIVGIEAISMDIWHRTCKAITNRSGAVHAAPIGSRDVGQLAAFGEAAVENLIGMGAR